MAGLKRSLTVWTGAGLMLNIVIGAGLLALPGLVVKQAGTQAIWAWLFCALAAVPLLAVFIIMGREHPNAGGVAHFAAQAFGRKLYAIVSFLFLGAVAFGLPAIALTGGHYIAAVAGGHPANYAASLLIVATATQLLSARRAGQVAAFISSCVIAALALIAVLGLLAVDWAAAGTQVASPADLSLLVVVAPFMMIFFAFTGWEVSASLSEEFIDPARDFPRAMLLSFGVATLLYLVMAFVAQASPASGPPEAAFTGILAQRFGAAAGVAMSVIAAVIIYANLMGAVWAVSRLVYASSREGLLPWRLETNAAGVPFSAVALTLGVLLSVLVLDRVGVLTIDAMLKLAGQNFLIICGIAALALLRLAASPLVRGLAAMAGLLVVGLLLLQEAALLYPAAICVFALAADTLRPTRSSGTENENATSR